MRYISRYIANYDSSGKGKHRYQLPLSCSYSYQDLTLRDDTIFPAYKDRTTSISMLLTPIINLLKPTGHVMHQQFNIQQLYVLPTLYLCVLYLSENKQRLVPLTPQIDWFL